MFLGVIELTTHFVEDVYEMTTKCELTLSNIKFDDDCSLDINDCTCQQCLRLVISDLSKRLQVTHYVEDTSEMATICGLNSLKDRTDENTSLDINDCTCPQCLSMIIGNLTQRIHNINRTSMQQVQSTQEKRNDGSNL
jgi:hypothetical protein